MAKAYHIVNWSELYEINVKDDPMKPGQTAKKGRLRYVRWRVHGHSRSAGYEDFADVAGRGSAAAAFGVFGKLLELAADQDREYRGFILDRRQRPMDAAQIARVARFTERSVERALTILCDDEVRWVEILPFPGTPGNSGERPGSPRSSGDVPGNPRSVPKPKPKPIQRPKPKPKPKPSAEKPADPASASAEDSSEGVAASASETATPQGALQEPWTVAHESVYGKLRIHLQALTKGDLTSCRKMALMLVSGCMGDPTKQVEAASQTAREFGAAKDTRKTAMARMIAWFKTKLERCGYEWPKETPSRLSSRGPPRA